ncbi:hypothetical protein [Serratia proteamaculans]|uniref:hypothetical protein n=1 Tax=Serratia proteamaculans TaxID=28151 RepID=UPI00217B330A|nr:hypothetical protein [Serratia proteamaculans]CAI1539472.1 Uncharacterised protein [Serratia proteamaculans]CAI1783568.1 Uncharacterised protein [Serratia proteamaculans]
MRYSTASISATLALLLGSLLLSGCQSSKKTVTTATASPVMKSEKAERDASELKQCQKNLNVLSKLQTTSYPSLKKDFDNLMLGASQYARVRFQVNDQSQETIDALYRYRVSYLCSEIQQAALEVLVTRAELPK